MSDPANELDELRTRYREWTGDVSDALQSGRETTTTLGSLLWEAGEIMKLTTEPMLAARTPRPADAEVELPIGPPGMFCPACGDELEKEGMFWFCRNCTRQEQPPPVAPPTTPDERDTPPERDRFGQLLTTSQGARDAVCPQCGRGICVGCEPE